MWLWSFLMRFILKYKNVLRAAGSVEVTLDAAALETARSFYLLHFYLPFIASGYCKIPY